MRIAVLGATGVAGRALIPQLTGRGHHLRLGFHSARSAVVGAQMCHAAGHEAMHCDILDPCGVGRFVAGVDAIINLATAIPTPGGSGDWELNDRVRREGTENLLKACSASAVRLVQQSVAMLHCVDDSRIQHESDAILGYGRVASAAESEKTVAAAALDWRIVRGAAFYGPGTGREEAMMATLADPAFRIPGDGSGWISFIHVEDFATAICMVVEHPQPREIYLVADGNPIRLRDLYARLAASRGVAVPPSGGSVLLRSFRVGNDKLRAVGWTPVHPAFPIEPAAQ